MKENNKKKLIILVAVPSFKIFKAVINKIKRA